MFAGYSFNNSFWADQYVGIVSRALSSIEAAIRSLHSTNEAHLPCHPAAAEPESFRFHLDSIPVATPPIPSWRCVKSITVSQEPRPIPLCSVDTPTLGQIEDLRWFCLHTGMEARISSPFLLFAPLRTSFLRNHPAMLLFCLLTLSSTYLPQYDTSKSADPSRHAEIIYLQLQHLPWTAL